MIILITGASHTGKTLLAQKLLKHYQYPYLSIDHLKMGLIRSGQTTLTPEDDDELTDYLWPIVQEMIKTAIENDQHLIIEGLYIPPTWQDGFDKHYLRHITYICLVMSSRYIKTHFHHIKAHASVIETRLDDSITTPEVVLRDNRRTLEECLSHDLDYVWIDDDFESDIAQGLARILGNSPIRDMSKRTAMRRKDREMSVEFGKALIDQAAYGVLSVNSDNYSSALPLSLVREGDALYFHSAKSGEKIGIYAKREKATVVFVGNVRVPDLMDNDEIGALLEAGRARDVLSKVYTTEFESVIVRGRLSEVTDAHEKLHVLKLICDKYTPEKMEHFAKAAEVSLEYTATYKIEIEEIRAKRKKYDAEGNPLPSDV